MKSRHALLLASLTIVAWMLPLKASRADVVLYDSTSLIEGQQSFVQAFSVATAGTLTVTLSNIPWLDTITNLTCFLSTTTGKLGGAMGGGTETFDVGAGTIYAHWFGAAQGAYNIGVLGMKVVFQASNVTPVPLPASFIALLSGLGLLFCRQFCAIARGRAMQSR